jgi:hypothetical protein
MAKIEKLTGDELALLPIVRDEYLKLGLATGPADRPEAQAAIADAYCAAGLEPPKVWIWLGSPWAGCIGAHFLTKLPIGKQIRDQVRDQVGDQVGDQVRDQVRDQVWDQVWDQVGAQVGGQVRDQVGAQVWDQVRDQVWAQVGDQVWDQVRDQVRDQRLKAGFGQHDANWLAFYDVFRRIKRVNGPERLLPLMRLAAVAGWWWPFTGACIVTERPKALHRDEAGRLHFDNGPALEYPDGFAIWAWHGMRVEPWLIQKKHRITPDTIEAEANAELRRVMLEIHGLELYMAKRGARLLSEDSALGRPRSLFEIDVGGDQIRVLRVENGSLEPDGRRRQFHLGVPRECATPHEAVAWTYGRPMNLYKEAVRT